jgi:signal transduction histidine kinase
VLGAGQAIAYIIHRVEDVTEFVRLKQRGAEQEKIAEDLRTQAGRMEAEVYLRAQEVQEANRHLRTANEELARKEKELTELYEKLHKLDELKSQFFANVSHELRTPLTLILGPVGKLLSSGELSAAQCHDLRLVERNARALLKHVNDLLDVSRLDAGKMAPAYAEIDLARLVRQTFALLESLAQERGFTCRLEAPESAPAHVDPDKMQRVIMNLLSNAFKFTPPGGHVRCALHLEAGRDGPSGRGNAILAVSDSGPGVPPHLRPDLIVSDVMMPGMSGTQMVQEIRRHRELDEIPIVMLTARADDEVRVKLLREGAQDYLVKPFSAEELLARVRNLVLVKRTRQHLQKEIAERRRAEEDVRRLNLGLERHAAQLEATNQELEAFSYSVSHDLRAPLRSIDGFSQALLEDCSGVLDERGKQHLQRVRASTQRMGQLIDDLLDLSRFTRAEMRLTSVDLSDLGKRIAEELQGGQPDRQVEFIIAQGLVTEGDARLLKVALENLLRNAWKFTKHRAVPRIELGATLQNGKPAFFVRDNGAGFDMAYAGKLFGAFQRLHSAEDFEGTGIGLATVARIIHRHGGGCGPKGRWARARHSTLLCDPLIGLRLAPIST